MKVHAGVIGTHSMFELAKTASRKAFCAWREYKKNLCELQSVVFDVDPGQVRRRRSASIGPIGSTCGRWQTQSP
jgi:hypothetical protein